MTFSAGFFQQIERIGNGGQCRRRPVLRSDLPQDFAGIAALFPGCLVVWSVMAPLSGDSMVSLPVVAR